MTDNHKTRSLLFSRTQEKKGSAAQLPSVLFTSTRSGADDIDPLLAGVEAEASYLLGSSLRDDGKVEEKRLETAEARLLALETEDGMTLFIRADRLAEDIERLQPDAVVDGVVDFSKFRDRNAESRGLGDLLWKAVTSLKLPTDEIVEQAKEKALEWAREKLGDAVTEKAYDIGSYYGAKALMWKIESSLAGRPGLYQWTDHHILAEQRCRVDDERLKKAGQGAPMLLTIHGTASYTVGSFSALRAMDGWDSLVDRFPGGIFGYEHRTFSQSPIENALEVVTALPAGARVSVLTHSRGGLVGDLLCLGEVKDEVIDSYRFVAPAFEDTLESDRNGIDNKGDWDERNRQLEDEAAEERLRLRQLIALLRKKDIQIQQYVRVACPARGTTLLSDNLDAALSDFLNLLQKGGGALVKLTATSLGGPAAGIAFGKGASSALGVLKRLVLEIAGRRIDPWMVPGIAAMRVDSPLAAFLGRPDTRRRDGIKMAVIAGDTEFDGLGFDNLGRRAANLFCDWRLFDRQDNDLVVDTESMYAGLANQEGSKYLYDQGEWVSHFSYFQNKDTQRAVHSWLMHREGKELEVFQPLGGGRRIPWSERKAAMRGGEPDPNRPVVILLPGIMGSHIEVGRSRPDDPGSGDRVWFDFFGLMGGQLGLIEDPEADRVVAEEPWERFYGDLADYLEDGHNVIRCAYDWRTGIDDCAKTLKARVDEAKRRFPGQPIHLLAHSMGGLVARAFLHDNAGDWDDIVASGGRLLMLGTPNNGAHLMLHTLLGKTDSMRSLEKVDLTRNLQQVLDIVAGFPGALSLLPRYASATENYYLTDSWRELKAKNTDRWYPDKTCGVPAQHTLDKAKGFWKTLPNNVTDSHPERIYYVFGQGEKTPSGLDASGERLKLRFTFAGDGSVTWESGKLAGIPDDHYYYMPVSHADLTDEQYYFPHIAELLSKGSCELGRLPALRSAQTAEFVLDAAPPVVMGEQELARALMGGGPRRYRRTRDKLELEVAVRAGDMRFLDQPILCGHYADDPIRGSEAALDGMLGGALSEQERMGLYAGDIGTSAILLAPRSDTDLNRGSHRGAVIVGLGNYDGALSTSRITDTVRSAVMRMLLILRDQHGLSGGEPVQLYSLLLGWNSTAHMTISDSVSAVTLGVLEANRRFRDSARKTGAGSLMVTRLGFIELYRDAAISAAYVVSELPKTLESDLKRLGARVKPARMLEDGKCVRDRLYAESGSSYWARLIISDADAPDTECSRDCYEDQRRSPIPQDVIERIKGDSDEKSESKPERPSAHYQPERLKYLFLSQRARAEIVMHRRQPQLVEALIAEQRRKRDYDPKLGRTLFQLMIPPEAKAPAREQSKLILVLDPYTANLPWELLQADHRPMVLETPMVRQLASMRYRGNIRRAEKDYTCIIANPDTSGYNKRFGESAPDALPDLPGATAEGQDVRDALCDLPAAVNECMAVRNALGDGNWGERNVFLHSNRPKALDVLNVLYERPYRVLVISGHGVFEAPGKDGKKYTGVVLSDGLLLTAMEIAAMEVVPELVFLNCCHLGSLSNAYSSPNEMAYSLSRQLIEMGVRCVIAAGWAVDDNAARTFAGEFFGGMARGEPFGEAVYQARRETYENHRGTNTWGAYQAYGDPDYQLVRQTTGGRAGGLGGDPEKPFVSVQELLDALENRRCGNKRSLNENRPLSLEKNVEWVRSCLSRSAPEWADRDDVLFRLGDLYRDFGSQGFALAAEAYEGAINASKHDQGIALKAVEQLANMESRSAKRLFDQGERREATATVNRAIRRLEKLRAVAPLNGERAALLGGALKRKVELVVTVKRRGRKNGGKKKAEAQAWKRVKPWLRDSAQAYREGIEGAAEKTPYNTLNVLALAWLADDLKSGETPELARRCGDVAHTAYAEDKSFWDAVMSADAALTAWLLTGDPAAQSAEGLLEIYQTAVKDVPKSGREWDSVVTHIRILQGCLDLRDGKTDPQFSDTLKQLGDRLEEA